MAKLREAKDKYNTEGVKIVSVDLFSVEAIKVCKKWASFDCFIYLCVRV